MDQFKKQTETSNTESSGQIARRVVGTLFGVVEIFLAIRLIFKGLGANPENIFVRGVYKLTQYVVGIFEGIFSKSQTGGVETAGILEPATLIAMIIIALIAWFVLKLMTPRAGNRMKRTEYSEHDDTKQ